LLRQRIIYCFRREKGAVAGVLEAGILTAGIALDKAKAVGTTDMGDAIAERILRQVTTTPFAERLAEA
jgi:hypothetical protein